MTWLGIAVAAFILLSCAIGYYKGFVKEAVSLMFMVLAIIVVWTINPYVSGFLKESTPVYSMIKEQCRETISEQLNSEGNIGEEMQAGIIESLPLPDSLKEGMEANNTSEVYRLLAVDTFSDYIADYLAVMITNGIGFMLSYLIAVIGIRIVTNVLDLMARLPVLNGVNRIAGIVVGGVRGLLIVWIALLILTIFYNTDIGKQGLAMVENDFFLKILYDNNIFIQIFLSIFYGK